MSKIDSKRGKIWTFISWILNLSFWASPAAFVAFALVDPTADAVGVAFTPSGGSGGSDSCDRSRLLYVRLRRIGFVIKLSNIQGPGEKLWRHTSAELHDFSDI